MGKGEGNDDEGNVKTIVREAATKEITEEKNKGYVVVKYVLTIQKGSRMVVCGRDIYLSRPTTPFYKAGWGLQIDVVYLG